MIDSIYKGKLGKEVEALPAILDLRASNLAGDLSAAEKDGIKTKVDIYSRAIKSIPNTTTYPVVLNDKIKHLHVNAEFITIPSTVFSIGDLLVITCDRTGGSTVSGITFTSDSAFAYGEIKLGISSTIFLKFISNSVALAWGDVPKTFVKMLSPNGTIYKVGVDDTGARTSIAL